VSVEEDLALQIGQVDAVRVDQRQRSHTGRRQELGDRIAEASDADDERAGSREALLRIDPKLRQQDVTAVAQQLGVVHLSFLALRQERAGEAWSPGNARPSRAPQGKNARTSRAPK